ncbi:MAG: hypothetical protein ACI4BA_04150 [Prevotella sp.]
MCVRYLLWIVVLLSAVSVAVYAVGVLGAFQGLMLPAVVSVTFSLVVNVSDILIWRRVASKTPDNLTTFYSAVSGFRMLLALAVMVVCYITLFDESGMMAFVIVFLAYYFVMLGLHSIFFSIVSNNSDKLNKQ